jgi:hypothetical protein
MKVRVDVSVLCVGGTIAMTGDGGRGVLPRPDGEALLAAVPVPADVAHLRPHTL